MAEGDPGWEQISESAEYLRERIERLPRVMVISGSGLGGLAEDIGEGVVLPYAQIPHFVSATVPGHAGRLVSGEVAGKGIALLQGRVHFYEGHSLGSITFPIRVLHRLGADTLIVTNAAGGLRQDWHAGDLMLIKDHINLVGMAGLNPLRGANDERLGPRFVDMSQAYDLRLRQLTLSAAEELGISLREGTYVMSAGPTFETPADVAFLQKIGADAVGMSTVPEVLMARFLKIKVLGISVITDLGIADSVKPASLMKIVRAAMRAEPALTDLVLEVIGRS